MNDEAIPADGAARLVRAALRLGDLDDGDGSVRAMILPGGPLPGLDLALAEIARLHAESPEVVDDVVAWLRERPHTATISLRFHGRRLKCAELTRVSSARP